MEALVGTFHDPILYHGCGLAAVGLGMYFLNSHKSQVSLGSAATVLLLCTLKAAIVVASNIIGKKIEDPLYGDSDCFLKVINVTNPDHYAAHPIWKDMQYNPDCDLQQFSKSVSSFTEQKIFLGVMACYILYCIFYTGLSFVGNIFKQENPLAKVMEYLSLENIIRNVVCQLLAVELFMLTAATVHFGQDVPFLTGNILHHADLAVVGRRNPIACRGFSEDCDGVPQGGAVSFHLTFSLMFLVLVSHVMVKHDHYLAKRFNSEMVRFQGFCYLFARMALLKDSHAIAHSTAVKEWRSALPFTMQYNSYSHVFGHHLDGGRMGGHPLTDPIFTWCFDIYRVLHNNILGLNTQMGSPQQLLFNVLFDGAVTAVAVYAALLFLHTYGSIADGAVSVARRITGGKVEKKKSQ